jgi:Cu/Ag efflux pump CusA
VLEVEHGQQSTTPSSTPPPLTQEPVVVPPSQATPPSLPLSAVTEVTESAGRLELSEEQMSRAAAVQFYDRTRDEFLEAIRKRVEKKQKESGKQLIPTFQMVNF